MSQLLRFLTSKRVIAYSIIGLLTLLLILSYKKLIWIWVLVALIIFLIVTAVTSEKEKIKIILLNCIALPGALLLAEAYFLLGFSATTPSLSGSYAVNSYQQAHPVLGYAPSVDTTRTSIKSVDDRVLYDVTYTIDQYGQRQTPDSNEQSAACLLFFGGSFIFGEGVEDAETLPNSLAKLLDGRYRVINFGFHGYGPHHMLALIQSDLIKPQIEGCAELAAVYLTIPNHVDRAVGNTTWDRNGPRYIVEDEKLVLSGSFSADSSQRISRLIRSIFDQSALFRQLSTRQPPSNLPEDIQTYVAIIAEAENDLAKIDGFSQFVVLFWNPPKTADLAKLEQSDSMLAQLQLTELDIHLISDVLDGYDTDFADYVLDPMYDTHPNHVAYQETAKYLYDVMSLSLD